MAMMKLVLVQTQTISRAEGSLASRMVARVFPFPVRRLLRAKLGVGACLVVGWCSDSVIDILLRRRALERLDYGADLLPVKYP